MIGYGSDTHERWTAHLDKTWPSGQWCRSRGSFDKELPDCQIENKILAGLAVPDYVGLSVGGAPPRRMDGLDLGLQRMWQQPVAMSPVISRLCPQPIRVPKTSLLLPTLS